jgi:hypothetical protein
LAKARFVRHPNFPVEKTRITAGGMLWKLEVREWAFAEVNLSDVDAGLTPTSNNPTIVTDHYLEKPDKIRGTLSGRDMTVRFYAHERGFSMLYLFDKEPFTPVSDHLQVEVLQRRAPREADVTLTSLSGATCAINAPDAKAYTMDTTLTFDTSYTDPARIFAKVPSGLQHLVISSHGGFQDEASKSDAKKMSLYICGGNTTLYRLTLADVTKAFETLKGSILDTRVIWIGGCAVAGNKDFCAAAAKAVNRPVVAPLRALLNKRFPKGKIDILDGLAIPVVFAPGGGTTKMIEFCANQDEHKFSVPA